MANTVITAVITISGLALAAGLLLGYASRRLPADTDKLVDRVDRLLPQTQCGQCGYAGCRPYATAIVDDDAPINLCAPGGQDTVSNLAKLLGRDDHAQLDGEALTEHTVASIDESSCIGCTHCREVCPVDAIVGAHQLMHTIIRSECTGCELCVPRCPVDCIAMEAAA